MIYEQRNKPAFSLNDLPKEAYALALVVVAVMAGLWFLSRPSDASTRMAALEQQAALIHKAEQAEGDLRAFPVGSVCGGELDDTFKDRLTNALMNSGLAVSDLEIMPSGKVGNARPLMAYTAVLKGSGTYEQALQAMEIIGHYRPSLFLDTISLRNQTSTVDLDVRGRFFCRWTRQG